ncbi:uncharacterized protein LOC143275052 [Babylonia areolata]|uniref:uncharacterized protein LOC143275052 n=1 Tax=Babylonia areolata TaxID=304850 RepID=UPI003FD3FCB0
MPALSFFGNDRKVAVGALITCHLSWRISTDLAPVTQDRTDHAPEPKYKRFWSFIKHQKSSNTGVAPMKADGRLTPEPSAEDEILNRHFQSVFSKGNEYSTEEFTQKCNMKPADFPELENIKISVEGEKKLLHELKPDKASGSDNISPRILKELASEMAPILTTMFQSSVPTGTVPSDWKDANVTPIFKKKENNMIRQTAAQYP